MIYNNNMYNNLRVRRIKEKMKKCKGNVYSFQDELLVAGTIMGVGRDYIMLYPIINTMYYF